MSSRRRARDLVDLDREADAVVHRHGQRLGAAHPAETGGQDDAARAATRRSAGGPARRTSRTCPGGCPGSRCRSRSRPSSGRTSSGPARSSSRKTSQVAHLPTRFEFAIRTRGAHSWVRKTRDRLARLDEQRLVVGERAAARGRSRRTRPSSGRRGPSRRRRRARRGSRRPPDRGCSSASGARLPAASRGRSARCRAGLGRVAGRSSSVDRSEPARRRCSLLDDRVRPELGRADRGHRDDDRRLGRSGRGT